MRLSRVVKTLVLQIPAIKRLLEQRNEAQRALDEILARTPEKAYQFLVGTEYARFALPIDYPPSRDWQPRWGYKRPPIPMLEAWFRQDETRYRQFIARMRANVDKLASVPIDYDEVNLPQPAWCGVAYCTFDALAFYTLFLETRPQRYIEIGSGITTCWANRAKADGGLPTRIISIDPDPRASIDGVCDEIIRNGLETVDPAIVDQLESGDILFLDGSHRSFMNSDVTVFFIDILPRLKPGVLVHIHDIHLPYDYPEWAKPWHWNEQYMLAVYMMGNRHRIDPVLPTAFLGRDAAFADLFEIPIFDLGVEGNGGWRGGGAMWFTHTH